MQELLGHRHITTTQIYDKRRRSTAESASRELPLERGASRGFIRRREVWR